jgi:DNA-binding MarR family transcriptional regulator
VLNHLEVMKKNHPSGRPGGQRDPSALPPHDILAELACTHTALRLAARRLGQLYDEAVAPSGLKATQVGVLGQIAGVHHAGPRDWPTLQALAERLTVSISALTHALRPLVRDGLVELRPDAHDGRTKRAVLTALGETRLREGIALWADANQRVEQVLGSSAAALRTLADDVISPEFLAAYEARRPFYTSRDTSPDMEGAKAPAVRI